MVIATHGLGDVEALPRVALDIADPQVTAAVAHLADRSMHVEGEVSGVEDIAGKVVVTLGHRYGRRTALLRRLNALHRIGVEVRDFAWLDPVTDPGDAWLDDAFDRWESPRHHDPDQVEPLEVARRRFGRLHGQGALDRLLDLVASPEIAERRRWTIAHAAVLTAFNTHTTEAGDALVAAAASLAEVDGYTSGTLLAGAGDIADLGRFGITTDIAEAPLVALIEHKDWKVHGAATQLLASLPPPRSDEAVEVLVRLGHELAGGRRSTEVRAEQIIGALTTADGGRTDVDEALDALRHHVSSGVRVDATLALAARRPEGARSLWEPWLASRSVNERTAAESMIAKGGDERDVPAVVRIVAHRTKRSKGISYWPPLAAEGLAFLVRHAGVPEACAALEQVRNRWERHDEDLREWLRLHHPDLVPPGATAP